MFGTLYTGKCCEPKELTDRPLLVYCKNADWNSRIALWVNGEMPIVQTFVHHDSSNFLTKMGQDRDMHRESNSWRKKNVEQSKFYEAIIK